jgi:chromosome segregation ATPase
MKKEEQKGKTLGQFREQVSSLEAEVTSLKHQLAGSKGRNKQLMQDVEKWKAYGNEADQMYNEKLTLLDECQKNMKKLEEKVGDLSNQLSDAKAEAQTAKETLETYTKSSWLKRMLMKI